MRRLLLLGALAVAITVPALMAIVGAQSTAPAAAPTATPNLCDQTFSGVIETQDGDLVAYLPGSTQSALPWADVDFYHKEQVKVLRVVTKEQNQNGPYTITMTETTACDGGATRRIADGSIFVEGVTYDGLNRIGRESLKSAELTLKRHEDRAKGGAKSAWNHKNAQKVQRNDLGQVLPPGLAKKQ